MGVGGGGEGAKSIKCVGVQSVVGRVNRWKRQSYCTSLRARLHFLCSGQNVNHQSFNSHYHQNKSHIFKNQLFSPGSRWIGGVVHHLYCLLVHSKKKQTHSALDKTISLLACYLFITKTNKLCQQLVRPKSYEFDLVFPWKRRTMRLRDGLKPCNCR